MPVFDVTYDIVTYESAEHGDAAERGFVATGVGLREAIQEIGGHAYEADCYPVRSPRWFTNHEYGEDFTTGARETRYLVCAAPYPNQPYGDFPMTQHLFRATFANGEIREQIYSRDLTHAWRVSYTRNGASATKYGFSGSREKAEKATKLPKACTDITVEIVHAMKLDAPTKAASAKPKKVKPFAKGERVMIAISNGAGFLVEVAATVKGIRGDAVTVTIPEFLNDIRVKLAHVQKMTPDPTPLAQAA
jgi:hypothetical protein